MISIVNIHSGLVRDEFRVTVSLSYEKPARCCAFRQNAGKEKREGVVTINDP
jgi:hypothetical protein